MSHIPRAIITVVLLHIKAVRDVKAAELYLSSPLIILHKIISLGCRGVCPGKWEVHCPFHSPLLNTAQEGRVAFCTHFSRCWETGESCKLALTRSYQSGLHFLWWESVWGYLSVLVYEDNFPLWLKSPMLFWHMLYVVFKSGKSMDYLVNLAGTKTIFSAGARFLLHILHTNIFQTDKSWKQKSEHKLG